MGETAHFENLMHFSTPVAKRRKAFNLCTAESVSSIENSLIDVTGNSSDISTLVLNPISSTAAEHQDTSFTARCHSANYEFGMLPGIPFEKLPIESCNDCTNDLPSDTDSSTDSSCDDVSTSSSSYGSDSVSDEVRNCVLFGFSVFFNIKTQTSILFSCLKIVRKLEYALGNAAR